MGRLSTSSLHRNMEFTCLVDVVKRLAVEGNRLTGEIESLRLGNGSPALAELEARTDLVTGCIEDLEAWLNEGDCCLVDVDPLPVPATGSYQLVDVAFSIAEDADDPTVVVCVERFGGDDGEGHIAYTTESASGGAVAGVNYVAASGILDWADGEDGTKCVDLTILEEPMLTAKDFEFCISAVTDETIVGVDCATIEILPAMVPLTGYYASPTGSPDAEGTYLDPWDLRSATDGTNPVPEGETLWLLPGVYEDPLAGTSGLGLDRAYPVVNTDTTIRSYVAPGCDDPTPAIVNGGFVVAAYCNNVTIRDIATVNPDPIPGGEPAASGSPWPGAPDPAPVWWDDWGNVGVALEGGEGHVVANVVAVGGGYCFSSFQASGFIMYGNIAYDNGWVATDRAHGHCIYARNAPSDTVAEIRHNMVSTSPRGATIKGNWAYHIYATNIGVTNTVLQENAGKGPVILSSEFVGVDGCEWSGNVVSSLKVGDSSFTDSDGNSFGKQGLADGEFLHTDNTYINGVKRVENNEPWSALTANGTRVFKTVSTWWPGDIGETPAFPVDEEGTFSDVSGGGGVDESRVWGNEYASNRAHIAILDLDLDGVVEVDLTPWASNGDHVCVYHYQDLISKVVTLDVPSYSGPVSLPVVEAATGSFDMFVAFKS